MTRGARTSALLPAAVLAAAVLLTGCGGSSHSAAPATAPASASAGSSANSSAAAGSSPAPAPAPSELAHMQKLVNEADSAAATADSDATVDK